MSEIKTERNQAVYQALLNGEKVKDVAEMFGINTGSVQSIYKNELKKEKRRKNPIYQLIEKHCEDEKFCTATFTVLTRINATTEEEFMKLERRYMLRYVRNCGERMVDLIERVQEDIRNNKESV